MRGTGKLILSFESQISLTRTWEDPKSWNYHHSKNGNWGHTKTVILEFFLFMILVCSRRVKDVSNVLFSCTFRSIKIQELTGWLRAVSYPECSVIQGSGISWLFKALWLPQVGVNPWYSRFLLVMTQRKEGGVKIWIKMTNNENS